MAAKKAKQHPREEPLISAVARRLGQAAGAVTNLTQGLLAHVSAENSSELPAQRTDQKTTARPAVKRSVPHPKKRIRRAAATTAKSKPAVAKHTRSHS